MRLHNRSLSKISLIDMLKKRKCNLQKFLTDAGISTYALLLLRCSSMGVVPPTEEEFAKAHGVLYAVSSPTEGIIILEPPQLIEENTGKFIIDTEEVVVEETQDQVTVAKKQLKKQKFTI